MDSIFDYKVFYIKYLTKEESFYNGKNIWYNVIEKDSFKLNVGKYIIKHDNNLDYDVLVLDITDRVTSLGSLSMSVSNWASLSGVSIDNNGGIFNLEIPYRKGDCIFEAGLYDRIAVVWRRNDRFDGEMYYNYEVVNNLVLELFNDLGMNYSDYMLLFYGFIGDVGQDLKRKLSINISVKSMATILDYTNINLLPALVQEYSLGGEFSYIKPYSQMPAWEIVCDVIIKTFDLPYSLDEIRSDLNIKVGSGGYTYNKNSRYLIYLDGDIPFIELKDGERPVARIELILLQSQNFTVQQMKLFENSLVKASKILKDVASAINGYIYDEGNGCIYFRAVHNINPPRIYVDNFNSKNLVVDISRKSSISKSISGIIGTSSFYPAGYTEMNVPDRNTMIYINDYKMRKYGLDIKQVKPAYGFLVKSVGSQKNFDEFKKRADKLKNKGDKKKILLVNYKDKVLENIKFYYLKDDDSLDKKSVYDLNLDFADRLKVYLNSYSDLFDVDVYGFDGNYNEDEIKDLYVNNDYDLVLVIRFQTDMFVDNLVGNYYVDDDIIKIGSVPYDSNGCGFWVNSKGGIRFVSKLMDLGKYLADNVSAGQIYKYAKEDNKGLFYKNGHFSNGRLNSYVACMKDTEKVLGLLQRYVVDYFSGKYSDNVNSIYSGGVSFYDKFNTVVISPMLMMGIYGDKFYNYMAGFTEETDIGQESGIRYIPYPGLFAWAWYEITKDEVAGKIAKSLYDYVSKNDLRDINDDVLSVADKGMVTREAKEALANYILAYYDSVNSSFNDVQLKFSYLVPQIRLLDNIFIKYNDFVRIYQVKDISSSLGVHKPADMSIKTFNERYPICKVGESDIYNKWYDVFYNDNVMLNRVSLYNYDKDKIYRDYETIKKQKRFTDIWNLVSLNIGDSSLSREEVMAIIMLNWQDDKWGLDVGKFYFKAELNSAEYKKFVGSPMISSKRVQAYIYYLNDIKKKLGAVSYKEFVTFFQAGYSDGMKALNENYKNNSDLLNQVIKAVFYANLLKGYRIEDIEFNALSLRIIKQKLQAYKSQQYIFNGYIWSPIGVYDYGDVRYISDKVIKRVTAGVVNFNEIKKKSKEYVVKLGTVVLSKDLFSGSNLLEEDFGSGVSSDTSGEESSFKVKNEAYEYVEKEKEKEFKVDISDLEKVLKEELGSEWGSKYMIDEKERGNIDDYIKSNGIGIYEVYMSNYKIIRVEKVKDVKGKIR